MSELGKWLDGKVVSKEPEPRRLHGWLLNDGDEGKPLPDGFVRVIDEEKDKTSVFVEGMTHAETAAMVNVLSALIESLGYVANWTLSGGEKGQPQDGPEKYTKGRVKWEVIGLSGQPSGGSLGGPSDDDGEVEGE